MNPVLAILPLVTFVLVMSITPGPNNFMLLASGARFGLQRSLPHLFGITGGFLLLLTIAYAGVAAVLLAWPAVTAALTVLCAAYLLWLASSLLREAHAATRSAVGPAAESARAVPASPAARVEGESGAPRPLRPIESALFQFVNPKAWGMAVAAVAMLGDVLDPRVTRVEALAVLLAVSAAINLPCMLLWTMFGAALRRVLERPVARRTFNLAMAGLVVGTAAWMLLALLRPADVVAPS